MISIIHYRGKCIGCNACVEAAPERWRISKKDGKCTLVDSVEKRGVFRATAGNEEYQANVAAALSCPVRIIRVSL